MAILRAALVLGVVPACYSPELRDCTVACASDDDCAPDQACSGGLCTAQLDCERGSGGIVDDPPGRRDAGAAIVDGAVDASSRPRVHVKVIGMGSVHLTGYGTCGDQCTYDVTSGPHTLTAIPDGGWELDKWMDACAGTTAPTCLVVVDDVTSVGVKFETRDTLDD